MRRFFLFWLVSLVLWTACNAEIERPTANAGQPQTNVAVGTPVTLDGGSSMDPSGRALEYTWTFAALPKGSAARLLGADTVKPNFTPDMTGTFVVQLIVFNGIAASDPSTVTVTAGKCGANVPIIEDITATPPAPNVGEVTQLAAKVTHADELDPCVKKREKSYAWKLSAAPQGSAAKLLAADTATPSLQPDVKGAYEVTLVVTDDLGHVSVPKTFGWTSDDCGMRPPTVQTITTNPMTPALGAPLQLNATIEDLDAMCGKTPSFTYAWQLLAVPLGSKAALNLLSASNPSFTPDVPTGAMTPYTVGLVVTDAEGNKSALKTLDIQVQPCGQNVPQVTAITSTPASPVFANQLTQLTATVVDADTDPMCNPQESFTFQWTLVSTPAGSKAVLGQGSTAKPSFTPDLIGSYVFRVVATDSVGHASKAFEGTIQAAACGASPPVANVQELVPAASTSGAAVTGATVGLNVNVQVTALGAPNASNDPDNAAGCGPQTLSYQWAFLEMPPGSTATLNDSTVVAPTFNTGLTAGKYVVGLTVTDSTKLVSKVATFTITADPAVNVVFAPNGFAATSLAVGAAQGISHPRGLTVDGTGALYITGAGDNRIRKIAAGAVTTFSANGFLNGPNDITFDSVTNQFFVSAGTGTGNRLIRVTPTGVQSDCLAGRFNGVQMYVTANGTRRLLAAERLFGGNDRVDFIDAATCTIDRTNDFNSGLSGVQSIWGATAFTRLVTGVLNDDVFESDLGSGQVRRNESVNVLLVNNGGTNTTINNALNEPRDIVATPCATANHPKLIVAEGGAGRISVLVNAGATARTTLATGFNLPVGLWFEAPNTGGCTTATPCLLVTDENFQAVMRITGDFCSL
jgi:hypothetical protein